MKPLTPKAFSLSLGLVATSLAMAVPARAGNLEHTRTLLSTKQCVQCDLSRSGLVFAELEGAKLAGANLTQANLSQANLSGADLTGANLAGAALTGANLAGANLAGADLRSADLRGAFLGGANLTGAQTENAALQGAIGLPVTAGDPADFYRWGMEANQQEDFGKAAGFFNEAIVRKADYAPAFLGRAMSREKMGDRPGAIRDLEQATALFKTQGDAANQVATQKIVDTLKNPPKAPGQNGFAQVLGSMLGLLRLFL